MLKCPTHKLTLKAIPNQTFFQFFDHLNDAEEAIKNLDDSEFNGTHIQVQVRYSAKLISCGINPTACSSLFDSNAEFHISYLDDYNRGLDDGFLYQQEIEIVMQILCVYLRVELLLWS